MTKQRFAEWLRANPKYAYNEIARELLELIQANKLRDIRRYEQLYVFMDERFDGNKAALLTVKKLWHAYEKAQISEYFPPKVPVDRPRTGSTVPASKDPVAQP